MTDFESNNLHPCASLDHLSLKNWTLPVVEKSENEEEDSEDEVTQIEGIASLIPGFIRESCKDPKTAELRVSYDAPTAQYTYTYAISWDDDETEVGTTSESKSEVETVGMKKTSSICLAPPPAPVDTKCDGPCKKVFPSNLLNTIGRCGHYLCTACYGIVHNSDGTTGCSSLSCFWKGASREESRKFYDEDVRRKQRAKAKDLVNRGVDVKPASRANSSLEISSTLNSSKSNSASRTNLSSLIHSIVPEGPLTMIPSLKQPPTPKTDTPIRARLIIVEPSQQYGMTHTYCNAKLRPETKLVAALKTMLTRKEKSVDDYFPRAKMYYGMLRENQKLGMRRIKAEKIQDIVVGDIPKLGQRLVLIMDMGDYVTKGVKIYLE